ncbi:MAG: VCBS repeat-containing protein [Flavobacteriales bacterium]|nr:VCBS repeat-containing protein [Flavobacteriales bacterium]
MRTLRDLVVVVACVHAWPAMAQFGGLQPVDGCAVRHVQACDLDGDDDLDLLATKEDGLHWYRNLDGQGDFGPHHVILPQPANVRLMVRPGDVDGDGDTDLVVARDNDSTLFLLENLNGLGAFGAPQPITTLPARLLPVGFTALHLADLTGDGLPEVLALFGGHNTVFRCTNAGGSFAPLETLPDVLPGISSGLFAVGDLDTDGDNDLLQHDLTGTYVVLENSAGDGSAWTSVIAFTTLSDIEHEAALLDLDGDGDLDIGLHGPLLQWVRNEGAWPSFTLLPLASGSDVGEAAYGRPGCGASASVVYFPTDPGAPTRWRHLRNGLIGSSPPIALNDVLKGDGPLWADLDGDGRDDLVVTYPNAFGWYRSELPHAAPDWSLSMPALDTLCWFGGSYALPPPLPATGSWSGPYVAQGQFQAFMAPPGAYALQHLVVDTTGCPVSADASLLVVQAPTVQPLVAPIPTCPEGPVQLVARPSTGVWFGAVDSTGLLDLDQRPILGEVVFVLQDAAGGSCASEGLWLDLPAPAPMSLLVDTAMCANDAPQTVVLSGPSPGTVTLSGPVFGAQYVQPHILAVQFDPALGPGTYALVTTADAGAFCADTLTTWITVHPEPEVLLTPFDTLCSSSGPYALHHAQPAGGLWSGFGVLGGHFDVSTHQFGNYLLHYSYTDANGCSTEASQSITALRRPSVFGPADGSIFCADEGIQAYHALPLGGLWSAPLNGADGSLDPTFIAPLPYDGAAIYTFTDATGGQCSNLPRTFSVQARTVPEVMAGGPYCDNGPAVELTGSPAGDWGGAASGSGTIGQFDPAASGAGLQVITLTAALVDECPGIDTVEVVVLAAPLAALNLPVDSLGLHQPALPLAGGSPAGGTYAIDGLTVQEFNAQEHGLGWVVVQYAVNDGTCTGTAVDSIYVDDDTGLGPDPSSASLRLWPNPATDQLRIDARPHQAIVRVLDATGRPAMEPKGPSLPLVLDVHALAAGRYTVEVVRGDHTDRLPLVVVRP